MEMQFQKNTVGYLKTVLHQSQKQEQTQQIRLSDTMPDIGRVLGCWGQILVRGKEWHGDSVGVTGGVMAWVLYAPEGEGQLCCVDTWIPFQMKWDMEDVQQDGVMEISSLLCHMDARMVSDRKMVVRANIGVQMHGMVMAEAALYTPAEVPSDLQVLQHTYPMLLPAEAGEKTFEITQALELSAGEKLHKLIRYSAQPVLTEYKIVADKLVLRGNAEIYALYMDEAGKLHSQRWQVPFSQYTQLDGEYAPGTEAAVSFELTQLEMELTNPEQPELKLGFTAQYRIQPLREITVTEDMYSPVREVSFVGEPLLLPAVLHKKEQTVAVEGALPEGSVLDVALEMELPQILRSGDETRTELDGAFQVLYEDENGDLQTMTQRWQKTLTDTVGEEAAYFVAVQPCPIPAAEAALGAELKLEGSSVAGEPIRQIRDAQLGDPLPQDPKRPSLILRRVEEDSLWQLAKSSGSTVEAIRKANGLEQEPMPGQLLLIPVS